MPYQLVYSSRALESPPAVRDEVVRICRLNNERDGITGLLLSDGARYLQALEGEERLVRICYGRIQEDRRHGALQLMSSRDVPQRQFGAWAITYKSTMDRASAGDFAAEVRREVARVSDPHLLAFFIGFASLSDRG